MQFKKHKSRFFRHSISAPFIYSMIIPLILLDIWIEAYHRVAFATYGINYVKRKKYIKIDRHKLQYLTFFEKLNCMYCGYANGLLQYSATIAGETEKYWCGIKHKLDENFIEPEHHKEFLQYGDEESYIKLSE